MLHNCVVFTFLKAKYMLFIHTQYSLPKIKAVI